jgi:hypothetical protein
MNYRLKRIQKGKPLKKIPETDASFANVEAVRQQARDDPEALEISMDAANRQRIANLFPTAHR